MEEDSMNRILIGIIAILLCIPFSFALVSVSHMGYHPDSVKTVTVYTHDLTGTFSVKDASGAVVYSGVLGKAHDGSGTVSVECQGNNPCLVGDFTNFKTP